MQSERFKIISEAYENRDLISLKKIAVPVKRKLNINNNFHSALMLSCNNLKHLNKIASLEADCIILNLEDGVSPQEKPFALVLCAIFLSYFNECDKKLVVRVNSLDEGGLEEIQYLNLFMPDAIRVPKITNEDDVASVLEVLNKDIELHLSIETAAAWHNLSKLKINKQINTFYLGILDLFADMGLSQELIQKENPTMLYILSHFLVTCKAMGVKPVSFVYQDFRNLQEFGMWISLEKQMGYDAKGCISPNQVSLVNKVFAYKHEELTKAREIVKLFEASQKNGITGFVDKKYGFIDEPIYKGALVVLNGTTDD